MKKRFKPNILSVYTFLFFTYIFIPIILIFIFAWNSGEGYSFPLKGFTWKWFLEFFNDNLAKKSIINSIIIAVTSATISTFFGVGLAFGLIYGNLRNKRIILMLLVLPVLMPSLTISIATLVYFRTINVPLGIPVVILSHVSISMSYVVLIMIGRIEGFSLNIQEASIDLGASWTQSIKDTILPMLFPAILASWLFSFMISWNEFIVTYFLIGHNITLPIYIFSQLRFGISPKVNVISVIIIAFTLVMVFLFITANNLYRKLKS